MIGTLEYNDGEFYLHTIHGIFASTLPNQKYLLNRNNCINIFKDEPIDLNNVAVTVSTTFREILTNKYKNQPNNIIGFAASYETVEEPNTYGGGNHIKLLKREVIDHETKVKRILITENVTPMNIIYDTQKHIDAIHKETIGLFKMPPIKTIHLVVNIEGDILKCISFLPDFGMINVEYLNKNKGNLVLFPEDKRLSDIITDEEQIRLYKNELNIYSQWSI